MDKITEDIQALFAEARKHPEYIKEWLILVSNQPATRIEQLEKNQKRATKYNHKIAERCTKQGHEIVQLNAVIEVLIQELVGFETCPYVSRNICIKELNDDAAMNCEDTGNECLLMYYKQQAAK